MKRFHWDFQVLWSRRSCHWAWGKGMVRGEVNRPHGFPPLELPQSYGEPFSQQQVPHVQGLRRARPPAPLSGLGLVFPPAQLPKHCTPCPQAGFPAAAATRAVPVGAAGLAPGSPHSRGSSSEQNAQEQASQRKWWVSVFVCLNRFLFFWKPRLRAVFSKAQGPRLFTLFQAGMARPPLRGKDTVGIRQRTGKDAERLTGSAEGTRRQRQRRGVRREGGKNHNPRMNSCLQMLKKHGDLRMCVGSQLQILCVGFDCHPWWPCHLSVPPGGLAAWRCAQPVSGPETGLDDRVA